MDAQTNHLLETFKGDLLPELEPYWVDGPMGKMLHHPLVVSILNPPGMFGHINRLYEQRKKALAEYRAEKNWGMYVFTHERAYRTDALRELIEEGVVSLDKAAVWEVISTVWTDSENVDDYDEFWSEIWGHWNSARAMEPKEKKALAALPDMIPVWHGLERDDESTLGFSWTTNEATGLWFARRFASQHKRRAYIAKGLVSKQDVKAYLLGRNEFEIIAFPDTVKDVRITPVQKLAEGGYGPRS